MSPTLANFLFEAANFLVLATALGWLLFRPIRRALQAERTAHDEQELRTAALRREAEVLAERARTAKDTLERELRAHRRDRLEAAEREAAVLAEQARVRSQQQQAELERELRASRRAAAEQLADTLGRVAARSVERLLEALDGPSLDLALVQGACASMEAWPVEARTPATVESARPLAPEALAQLHAVLGAQPVLRVTPELGAGVRVTTPAGQVDGTAIALARHAQREVMAAATIASEEEGTADA